MRSLPKEYYKMRCGVKKCGVKKCGVRERREERSFEDSH